MKIILRNPKLVLPMDENLNGENVIAEWKEN